METGLRKLCQAVFTFSPACWGMWEKQKQAAHIMLLAAFRVGNGSDVMILLYYVMKIPPDEFPAAPLPIWICTSDNLKTGIGKILSHFYS